MWSDARKAFFIVWVTVSVTLGAAAVAPLIASPDTIARLAPRCEAKTRYGRECFLCGATTGFIAIGRGDFASAESANRASLPLYFGFVSDAAAAIFVLVRRLR
jgi:uncharacterized membrane-anchored protein